MSTTKSQEEWGIHIEWMVDYLLTKGITLDDISEVTNQPISDPSDVYVTIDDYLNLFSWSADRLSSSHLGLDIGDQLKASKLGILGYLIQNAPTIADYCDMLQHYQSILMTGMEFSFRETSRFFVVEWKIFRPPSESVRHDIEMTLSAFLSVLRNSLEEYIVPQKVFFSHSCKKPYDRYTKSFGSNVLFDQNQNSLFFSPDQLSMRLNDTDPALLAILRKHADEKLEQLRANEELVDQAKFLITTSLQTDDIGVEQLARMLHLTPRTLNRHLGRMGQNYQQLREEVILQLAKQLLAETDASITVIADKLGYSESSAFIRAFKRMSGSTPLAYRKNSTPA